MFQTQFLGISTSLNTTQPPTDGLMCEFVLNLTIKERADTFLYLPEEKWLFLFLLPLIVTLGVISNALFLYVVVSLKEMHTSTNFYLANLAIADVFFLTTSIGQMINQYLYSPLRRDWGQSNSNAGCCVINFIVYLCYFGSIFIVTLLAVERFYAVCLPLKHLPLKGKRRTAKLTLVTWFFAALFAGAYLPRLAIFKSVCLLWPDDEAYAGLPLELGTCNAIYPWTNIVSATSLIVPFYTAFITNCILYALIIKTLNKRARNDSELEIALANDGLKARNSIARMLIVNGVLFFLCQAPFQSTAFGSSLVEVVRDEQLLNYQQYLIWTWFAAILVYLNSVINPVVYNVMSSR